MADSPACVQQFGTLVADMDGQTKVLVRLQKIDNLLTEVVDVDNDFGESCRFKF